LGGLCEEERRREEKRRGEEWNGEGSGEEWSGEDRKKRGEEKSTVCFPFLESTHESPAVQPVA
jgi:hypothetical protein